MGVRVLATVVWICLLATQLLSAPDKMSTGLKVSDRAIPIAAVVRFGRFGLSVLSKTMAGNNNPSAQIIAELSAIREELSEINGRLDTLTETVKNVMRSVSQNHEMTRITAAFSEDVRRIDYFKSSFGTLLTFDDANQVIVNANSESWAEAILAMTADGIGPTLFDIDQMVKGSFGTRPVVEVYSNGLLLANNRNIWDEVDHLVESLVEMQDLGYAFWGIALDILDRSNEKGAVKDLLEQRLDGQQSFLTIDERYKVWPAGHYGLVQAASGCPDGDWSTGLRHHDTEDDDSANSWSPRNLNNYIQGSFQSNNIDWRFCVNPRQTGQDMGWPRGSYCLFAGSSTCPGGFSRGWLHLDDEDDDNANRVSGTIPYGTFDRNTRYEFCCRYDGSTSTAIRLPLRRPFVLLPMDGHSCQQVDRMTVTEMYLHFDCEDDDNANARGRPFPKETNRGRNMRIYMCHYQFQ